MRELNDASSRLPVAWPATIALFLLGLITMPWGLIVWGLAVPVCWWLFLWDKARRSAVVFYDVNDQAASWYDALVTTATDLRASQRLWRLSESGQVQTAYQHKINAGASHIVTRQDLTVQLGGPRWLVTNVAIPALELKSLGIYFLPDRILVRDGKKFSDVSYQYLSAHFNTTRFIESGPVPSDAQQVDRTWRYVNAKGGPDKRFKDNRVIPVMLYGETQLRSSTGLRWDIQASSVQRLHAFTDAILAGKALDRSV
ncbi:hypothetical protein [Antiquaquibacter soli]|uniref:Uncharacterized protein n=1 Tax=Antiquaquibacter soli TaxID=3064523 RepID=A0ABT9BQC2_9MICO|nr:hypothetical protein [Protaetiibacter sp. WY-16]MDO7883139.1 hypothetical protein [Protaetiibacter sp. WY-16]